MIQPKPEITNTPPAHHGAFDYTELRQLGYSPDEVIDFSVNSNPYGPPPGVREAIARVPLDRYPDRECIALREKLAARHNVNVKNIVVGNGTAELLLLIGQAFIRPGDKVAVFSHTFSEYERVAHLSGGEIAIVEQRQEDGFSASVAEYRETVRGARAVFECNPDNPSGLINLGDSSSASVSENSGTLFINDEAYVSFLGEDFGALQYAIPIKPNVLSLRSLTKDYALAGLRLGYAVGHADVIEALRRVRPAWNVNGLAQAAGLAVLDQDTWLSETISKLLVDQDLLDNNLRAMGYEPSISRVHYFLVNVGNGAAFRSKLLEHKIMVRDCASFGLPEYVRIATRTPEDNAKLLAAVEKIRA